ncbi:MAG TPA: type I DNA topoisomerase, partial [Alphaproteobacteria bacterium]|nr:type I DNA topoisomerase [Alphaproteobacteria bacterium]
LGKDFEVLASYGHVRDLVPKEGAVDTDNHYAMRYDVIERNAKHVDAIARAVKKAKAVYLATDPDREGEAISWHVLEILKQKKAIKDIAIERVVFNAITKSAVLEAMAHPRAIDGELVDAYLARRALDYLVGFSLSPILWRKLPGARSAGRVQSVALRLVCEREIEIEAFKPREYWTVDTLLKAGPDTQLTARLHKLNGKRADKFDLGNEAQAMAAKAAIERTTFAVQAVEAKPVRRNPPPPFTTSTMQQEAARKLGFSATRTMQVAQRLYEGVDIGGETVGLITYMRTDGVSVAPEALTQTRSHIASAFGPRYLPDQPRHYKTKQRNAQEAHEAIRPTDVGRKPEDVARRLEPDMLRLYELVWKRMVASQMEAAEIERTTIDFEGKDNQTGLRATGSIILFDGFLTLYQEGRDDEADEDGGARLPKLSVGQTATPIEVTPEQHFTEPPPRYSEASLVKKLEELGIGRPSTYASILQVLRDRSYVRMDRNRFIPEDKGRLVTAFLSSFFKRYVEYDFTASVEEKLDAVSAGDLPWKAFLAEFWRDFSTALTDIADLRITNVLDALNEELGPHIFPQGDDGRDPRACTLCADGRLGIRLGKFGAFIGCSNYPNCKYTRQLGVASDAPGADGQPKDIGLDPDTGLSVTLRNGRFGPYLQLGEGSEDEKPKRASIPKAMDIASIDLQKALALLALPREVGTHPESGKPILAAIGRFGPYLSHDGKYANLESVEDVLTIGINRAVTVLAEKKARGGRPEPKALKELGPHPEDGAPVRVMSGRYGPYVAHNKVYATIPRGSDPQEMTLEACLPLLAEKAAKGPGKKGPKKAAKPAAAPKKAASTAPAAKPVAKPKAKPAAKPKAAASSDKPKKRVVSA